MQQDTNFYCCRNQTLRQSDNGVLQAKHRSGVKIHITASGRSRPGASDTTVVNKFDINLSTICTTTYVVSLSNLSQLTARSNILLEKEILPHRIKKLFCFYGTQRFITEFTKACDWSASWKRRVRPTSLQTSFRYPFWYYPPTYTF